MTRDIRLAPIAVAVWAIMFFGIAHQFAPPRAIAFAAALVVLAVAALGLCVRAVRRVPRADSELCVYKKPSVEAKPSVGRAARGGRPHEKSQAAQRGNRWLEVGLVGLLLLVVALTALWRVSALTQDITDSGVRDAAAQKRFATLTGRVVSEPKAAANSFGEATVSYNLQTTHLLVNGQASDTPMQIRVMHAASDSELVEYGSTIQVQGNLSSTDAGERTVAMLRSTSDPKTVQQARGLARLTNSLRAGLVDLVSGMTPQAKGLVPGAAVGDTRAMDDDLSQAMKVSGLTHITAVSGSHFTIIFLILSGLFWRMPRTPRAVCIALACAGFVLLVHPSGSVLRALMMGLLALFALSRSRRSQGISALCWAVVILLLIDPFNARDYGFALSVCATGGLIVGSGPIGRFLHRPTQRDPFMPKVVADVLSVPIAAQLAVGPILILLQPYVSLYSVPANIAAAPALFPATILGLAATFLAPLSHALAYAAAVGASGATWWISATATFFAGLPGAMLGWPEGVPGALLLACATVAGVGLCFAFRRYGASSHAVASSAVAGARTSPRGPAWRTSWRVRAQHSTQVRGLVKDRSWYRICALVACGALVACLVFALRPLWLRTTVNVAALGDDWQVAACDVGQGDGFLAHTASGQTIMFDVGQEPNLLVGCLKDVGVEQIDVLVLTHFHADHVGALDTLLSNVEVGRIITGPLVDVGSTARATFNSAAAHGVPIAAAGSTEAERIFGAFGQLPSNNLDGVQVAQTGSGTLGTATQSNTSEASSAQGNLTEANVLEPPDLEILWPTVSETKRLQVVERTGGDPTNDLSLAVRVELTGGVSAMFLGDLEQDGQDRMARKLAQDSADHTSGAAFSVDLVKMAHHGSASQSTKLAQQLSPTLALVGVGEHNDYGHPTQSALSLYEGVGAAIRTTAQCGTFTVKRSAERWFVTGDCP